MKHLWTPTIEGKTYCYYRRAGRVVRIRAADGTALLPTDPGFLAAYEATHATFDQPQRPAKAGPGHPGPRSLSALILSYRQNEHWRDLSPTTQRAYLRRFDLLEKAYGAASVPALDRVRVLEVQKQFTVHNGRRVPSRANEAMKALNVLVQHAVDIGWRSDNPVAGVRALRTGDGHVMWTAADFATFVDHPDICEPLKRAVVLGYYTGLRISDCVALPRSARQGGVIVATTQKTGATAYVAEHPELTRWLDAAPVTTAPTLLTNPAGRPWHVDTLKHMVTQAVRMAGLGKLSMHGLRMALTARLAEAGVSDAAISAVVPHSAALTRFYRRHADQRALATAAMARLPDRVPAK